jgi:hypothetical protein
MSYGTRITKTHHYCGCETIVTSTGLTGIKHDRLIKAAEMTLCMRCTAKLSKKQVFENDANVVDITLHTRWKSAK